MRRRRGEGGGREPSGRDRSTGRRSRFERTGLPPGMAAVEVIAIDDAGELVGESPAVPGAAIRVLDEDGGEAPLEVGDRALMRLETDDEGMIEGRLFRKLARIQRETVGVVERQGQALFLRPSRKTGGRDAPSLLPLDPDGLELDEGDLVRARLDRGKPLAPPRGIALERLGKAEDTGSIALTIAADLELPIEFSAEALAVAEKAQKATLGDRVDLRDLDLVTIDGADARDFDDAVWADPEPLPDGGFRAVVAIADVSHYVQPGDPLDREALERGNSVYFPDRVIPMLPEALSNGLCSLKPHEDRASIAVELVFDGEGQLKRWRFMRALIKSRARLTYEQVQMARDGSPDALTAPLLDAVINPLYAVYEKLAAARRKRGTIELELPERQILLNEHGKVQDIVVRRRLASHMLVEELMIAANVAAARALAEKKRPCLFRVHDKPDPIRIEALAQYLERLGIGWSRTAKKPGDFTRMLERIVEPSLREQVSGFVLRAQAQAMYQPDNLGHFGLNLRHYAHFTSPIRRYSDLVVHRLLIHHEKLAGAKDGRAYDVEQLERFGRLVSATERKAVQAERMAFARYTALFMLDKKGAQFTGRVIGVQRFGLFVMLDETGAEGLVPVSTLGEDAFHFDEQHQALVGIRYGEAFGLGDLVTVTLADIDIVQGQLSFRIDVHERAHAAELARAAWAKAGPMRRGRQTRGRPPHAAPRRGKR
jgi:ribonuclease R